MKLTKMALFAATAAIAAMMFIGASTASATGPWISICKKIELLNCTAANRVTHPLKGKIRFLLGKGFFLSAFKIECASGLGESSSIESQQNGSIKGSLESLSFTACSGGCTTMTVRTPQAFEINMEVEATESWRMKLANAKILFSGCTFGVECEFEGTLNLKVGMDATGAFTDPAGTSFNLIKGSAFLCGSTMKWEEGRTRFDWVLDQAPTPTVHQNVTPSLIGKALIITA
jgi:hypothetical protein